MKTLTLRTLAVLHLLLALTVLTALTHLDNTGVQATCGRSSPSSSWSVLSPTDKYKNAPTRNTGEGETQKGINKP